jgi:hypothetical protein
VRRSCSDAGQVGRFFEHGSGAGRVLGSPPTVTQRARQISVEMREVSGHGGDARPLFVRLGEELRALERGLRILALGQGDLGECPHLQRGHAARHRLEQRKRGARVALVVRQTRANRAFAFTQLVTERS